MNTTSPSSHVAASATAAYAIEVSLPVATQVLVAAVTLVLLIFFLRKYMVGLASWEVCYVGMVEFITYVIMLGAPRESYILTVGTEGQTFVWLRYASWLMTCPVLLQMISQVVHHAVPDADFTTQTMMSFIMTAVMGITSTLYRNPYIKWTTYILGCMAAATTFGLLYSVWHREKSKMDPLSMAARYELIFLMSFTWLAFPVVFALSPETSGLLSQDTTIVAFAVLDLFCKNMYGYMCWYFNYCNAFSHRGTELGIRRENSLEGLGKNRKLGSEHNNAPGDIECATKKHTQEKTLSPHDNKSLAPLDASPRDDKSLAPLDVIGSPSFTRSLGPYPNGHRPSESGA